VERRLVAMEMAFLPEHSRRLGQQFLAMTVTAVVEIDCRMRR
jgi:hypothetical protein